MVSPAHYKEFHGVKWTCKRSWLKLCVPFLACGRQLRSATEILEPRENAWKEIVQQVMLEVILYVYQSGLRVNISVVLYNEYIVGGKYTRKMCVKVEDTEGQLCEGTEEGQREEEW